MFGAKLGAIECLKKSHGLMMGKTVFPLFLSCFDRNFLILTSNNDIHKSLHEFEISQNLTRDYRVSCP